MAFVGLAAELLLKYANVRLKQNGTTSSLLKSFHQLPNVAANLRSYTSACQEDPELKSFDYLLHLQTSKLINSLAAGGGKTEDLPLDSLTEVCGFLLKLSQYVVNIITYSKEDVLKNEELKSLVDLYFESTTKTLNLFNTVENCVKKAEISQLNIRVAIKQFEKESMDTNIGGNMKKNKYAKTLEELNKVKAMEDPFGDEFVDQYKSVYEEQCMLVDKFREMQVELDKKQKNSKKRRKLATIVFAAAFISVFALSMYLCTVVAPPVVVAVAIGLTTSIGTAGIWVNGMVKDYENALETHKDLLLLTENSTKVNMEAMKTIMNLVEKLIISISSIVETVEVAVQKREEETIKIVLQEIIKKVDVFAKKIEEVGEIAAECSKLVASGKVRVLEHITTQFH